MNGQGEGIRGETGGNFLDIIYLFNYSLLRIIIQLCRRQWPGLFRSLISSDHYKKWILNFKYVLTECCRG